MMKRILTLCLGLGLFMNVSAQTKIAVYVSSVLSEERNTLLADNLVEAFAENDKYIAVNRSSAVNAILSEAHEILQNGHIDFTQVANATKQFGESQVCAVSVIKLTDTYVFRASIVDVETNAVIKSTSHHITKSYNGDLTYNDIYEASQKLINGLLDCPKPEPVKQQQVETNNKKSKKKGTCDIAWGIAGAGYPWNLATSFNFRYGTIVGLGLYADIGAAFTHVSVESSYSGSSYFASTTVTKLHYAAGAKFYVFQGLNVGCGYGSLHNPLERVRYNFGAELDKNEAKAIRKQFNDNRNGLLIHAGYDWYSDFLFFLGFNGGISYDLKNKKIEPMFNLKIGLSFRDI